MKLKVILSLIISVFFVILSFYKVSWDELLLGLSSFNPIYTIFAILLFIVMHGLRSLRLKILLDKISEIKFFDAFGLNAVGLFAVVLFPWRLGEFVRMYYLSEKRGVKIISTLTIAFIERITDVISIYVLFLYIMLFGNIGERVIPLINVTVGKIFWGSTYLVLTAIILFALLVLFKKKFSLSVLPDFIKNRFERVLFYLSEGLKTIPSIKIFILIMVLSLLLWILGVLVSFIFIKAFPFGDNLTFESALFVTILLIIGITIPTAPGFVGNFQFFAKIGLMFYGVSESDGLAMAIVYHFVNISFHFVLALFFIAKYPFSLNLLKNRLKHLSNKND